MSTRVRTSELCDLANSLGMGIQHDCGGYRVVRQEGLGYQYVYPDGGICPTATKRQCLAFLMGYNHAANRLK